MAIEFIEPCCISKQLPPLMRERSIVPFQTNGDVTFEHIIKAVSCIAGDDLKITIASQAIGVSLLRVLAWMGRRGWLREVRTLTHDNQSGFIHKELSDAVREIHCYHHEQEAEGLIIIEGEKGIVVIQGKILEAVTPGHYFYYAHNSRKVDEETEMFIKTISPLMKAEDTFSEEIKADSTENDVKTSSNSEIVNAETEETEAKEQTVKSVETDESVKSVESVETVKSVETVESDESVSSDELVENISAVTDATKVVEGDNSYEKDAEKDGTKSTGKPSKTKRK